MYASRAKGKEKETHRTGSGSGNAGAVAPEHGPRLRQTRWKTPAGAQPPIAKKTRFRDRNVTILHEGQGLSTSLRAALAVPEGQLKGYLARKNEAEIEKAVEERVKERMREGEKLWVQQCLDEGTSMGVELARAVEAEVVKRVQETDWGRQVALQRRRYEEMLGARNEAVRGLAAVMGKMEAAYYQYGGTEERMMDEEKLMEWVESVCQSNARLQEKIEVGKQDVARANEVLRTALDHLEQIESESQ
ncbi:MAG: hypothetical protein Q9187_008914 [Circinaria calcarea]